MAVFMAGLVQAESVRTFTSVLAGAKEPGFIDRQGYILSLLRLCPKWFHQDLLIHDAVSADYKRHDPALPVFHGIRQNGKPACHLSVRNVVLGSTFGAGSPPG